MIKKLGLVFLILGVGILGYFLLNQKVEILNPLGKNKNKGVFKSNYKVFGFLPSWNVGKTVVYKNEVTDLIFLGIEADENGNLIWDYQAKKIYSDDYLNQKNKLRENGGRNILGVKLFDDDKIIKLMAIDSAKTNLVEQIKKVIAEDSFDGVNIDFEYQGNPTAVLEDEFYSFINQLSGSGIKNISVDVFANTIIKGDSEGLKRILGSIDNLIVMAYDFHRSGSNTAGPVAPIGAPVGERNILEVVQKISGAGLDRRKMVLAYPLYGYEWKTYTTEFKSPTKKGWIALASYKRMKDLLVNKDQLVDLKENWDETSMSPWLSYSEGKTIKQIYYENLESLKRKFQLVKDNQLGGLGFWALGYEGDAYEIWDLVSTVLN
jgi:spore germination protein YaaH